MYSLQDVLLCLKLHDASKLIPTGADESKILVKIGGRGLRYCELHKNKEYTFSFIKKNPEKFKKYLFYDREKFYSYDENIKIAERSRTRQSFIELGNKLLKEQVISEYDIINNILKDGVKYEILRRFYL